MVEITQLAKSFAGKTALLPLDLEVGRGEIFGLLGHNGAGKSTTMGCMLGHLHPDQGEVRVAGYSVQSERSRALRRVGAIFEAPAFYEYLSGLENLRIITAFTHPPRPSALQEVLELVGLSERIQDPVASYSHGMRTRLALAQALLPDPEFILLDEPSEGLDPEGIQEMRETILRLRAEKGLTVMLSSHLLSEVEQLCDRVAILNRGKLIFSGDWKASRPKIARYHLDVVDWEKTVPLLLNLGAEVDRPGMILLPEETDPATFLRALITHAVAVRAFAPSALTLEDFYLQQIHA